MHRTRMVMGVLGLVLAAGAVSAEVPKTVKLFGQDYDVDVRNVAGTYKNGLTVKQVSDFADRVNTRKIDMDFVQGATPAADRLFVVSAPQPTEGETADQFFVLTGADERGIFSTTNSTLTQFFGGAVDFARGGRPTEVHWLNDDTTAGTKADRNIIIQTFTNDDRWRFYDFDTMQGDFYANEVAVQPSQILRGVGAITDPDVPWNDGVNTSLEIGDPNAPYGGFLSMAEGPGGSVVVMGRGEANAAGAEVSVMDPKTGKFYPVLTDISDILPKGPNDEYPFPSSMEHFGGNEYWLLYGAPEFGGAGVDETTVKLVRIELGLPADLTKDAKGSITAKVLGEEELLESPLGAIDANDTGLYGLALGRELSAGKRVVYLGDWNGNLITLTPR